MATEQGKEWIRQAARVLGTAFRSDEFIWCGESVFQQTSMSVRDALRYIGKNYSTGVFMAINPAIGGNLPRANQHVACLRNFLIEFDDGSSPEEQMALMKRMGVPYSTCVFSGGKSLHFLICLDRPVSSIESYKMFFRKLCAVLHTTGTENDEAVNDPCRLTRYPFAFRNSVAQMVVEVNGVVSLDAFIQFFERMDVKEAWEKSSYYAPIVDTPQNSQNRKRAHNLVKWYVTEFLQVAYSGYSFVPCPVCRAVGKDKSKDNMHVHDLNDGIGHNDRFLYHCFANPEHDAEIPKRIAEIQKITMSGIDVQT